jgi:hypothetical protein
LVKGEEEGEVRCRGGGRPPPDRPGLPLGCDWWGTRIAQVDGKPCTGCKPPFAYKVILARDDDWTKVHHKLFFCKEHFELVTGWGNTMLETEIRKGRVPPQYVDNNNNNNNNNATTIATTRLED